MTKREIAHSFACWIAMTIAFAAGFGATESGDVWIAAFAWFAAGWFMNRGERHDR